MGKESPNGSKTDYVDVRKSRARASGTDRPRAAAWAQKKPELEEKNRNLVKGMSHRERIPS